MPRLRLGRRPTSRLPSRRRRSALCPGWLIPSRIELLQQSSDLFDFAYSNAQPHPGSRPARACSTDSSDSSRRQTKPSSLTRAVGGRCGCVRTTICRFVTILAQDLPRLRAGRRRRSWSGQVSPRNKASSTLRLPGSRNPGRLASFVERDARHFAYRSAGYTTAFRLTSVTGICCRFCATS